MKALLVLIGVMGFCVPTAFAADAAQTGIAQEAFDLRLSGKVDEAVQRLEAGLAADSTQAALFYELSRARLFLMDFKGMQEAVEKAVALAPDSADYHHFAGQCCAYSLIDAAHHNQQEQIRRFAERAIEELEAALRCDPDHHEARYTLVQMTMAMAGDMGWETKTAEEHARILEEKDPVMGARARASILPAGERAGLWEKVIREHPDQWNAWYESGAGLIDAWSATQDGAPGTADKAMLDRAAVCIDKALEMNPRRSYILLRLVTAFAMARDWDRATAITQRYLTLDPPVALKAFATARLGQIKLQSGDSAGGKDLMSKAMEMDPHLWRGFMPPPEEIFTRP